MFRCFRSAPTRLPLLALGLFTLLSLASRIALMFAARHDLTWNASIFGIFASGLFFDLMAGLFAVVPWVLYAAFMPTAALRSRPGRVITTLMMVVFSSLLIFITVSEWFFWDEFGVRFNFIAVDYLIWTQEVLGNIMESYPMVPIIGGIVALGGLSVFALHRVGALAWTIAQPATFRERAAAAITGIALPVLAVFFVSQSSIPMFTNQYHGELAKNGCWSFFAAAKQMELNYDQWYRKLPEAEALAAAKKLLVTPHEPAATSSPTDFRRAIRNPGPKQEWNVILICMESFSSSYMSYAGNTEHLTPHLDRLAGQSVFFENLFATGTRTVRGMEALTLNLPPTPGQAIIYRPEGHNLKSTFTPFLDRGYDCAFFYGGDGKFDYMNRYFSTAGCRIMDVNAWEKKDVTFKTSWGACDEDLFNKTLSEADKAHAKGQPFHYFCMTTSNHRPFDFPANRVPLKNHTRHGAVQYSDWAIGNLIENASRKPWFNKTVFVIVADHCASSAGRSDLDVTKFHIPAMIYSPALVPARTVSKLCSQIDLMPSLFGMMSWSYDTLSYGHGIINPAATGVPDRAFISNYQKIALLTPDSLAILKPKRQVSSYACDFHTGVLSPLPQPDPSLENDAVTYYQSASWLFNSGKMKRNYVSR